MVKKENTQVEQPLSSEIASLIKRLNQVQQEYDWCHDVEAQMNALSQDYLHQLELVEMTYHERARVATELQRCRINRRAAKDTASISEPLVVFLRSDRGKVLLSHLNEVLGQTRKIEKAMSQRSYIPRVMGLDEFRMSREDQKSKMQRSD